jgi:hypothetical protein
MRAIRRFLKGQFGHPRHEIGANTAGGNGFGAPYKQAWEYRPLPGAGAQQWAWTTLALPRYTPIGWGVRNKRQLAATASCPVMVAFQGATISPVQGSPVMGQQTGQFVTQPLLDVTIAEQNGLAIAPQAPGAYEFPSFASGA